jgi:hypothetical protein
MADSIGLDLDKKMAALRRSALGRRLAQGLGRVEVERRLHPCCDIIGQIDERAAARDREQHDPAPAAPCRAGGASGGVDPGGGEAALSANAAAAGSRFCFRLRSARRPAASLASLALRATGIALPPTVEAIPRA